MGNDSKDYEISSREIADRILEQAREVMLSDTCKSQRSPTTSYKLRSRISFDITDEQYRNEHFDTFFIARNQIVEVLDIIYPSDGIEHWRSQVDKFFEQYNLDETVPHYFIPALEPVLRRGRSQL